MSKLAMERACYEREELHAIGFKEVGQDVQISRRASIYNPHVITLGDHVRVDDFCVLSGGTGIQLGSHIHIGCFCNFRPRN